MKKINEIFYSIQGEGFYTGTSAIFIRFSGCNLHCDFCDTRHEEGSDLTDEEIIAAVRNYPGRHVVLTGGEPGLFVDTDLIRKLHQIGKFIQIETNGTCKLPEGIDWVTCSPKEGIPLHIGRIDELKIVYTGQDLSVYENNYPGVKLCLQPCSMQNTREVLDYILTHPQWRISVQLHKLLQIP